MFTACWGGVVNAWETAPAEPKPLQSIAAHKGAARFVRVSPDGQHLATCGNDLLVKVWNLADGKQLQQFAGHERHVYGVAFHPDGEHLVSQDLMGAVYVWNLKTGKQQRRIDASVMTGYDNKFAADMGGSRDLAFNADGSQWASAGITKVSNSFAGVQDPIIVVFNWPEGQEPQHFKAADTFKGIAWGVRFHADGFIIGAGADRSGKGELWFFKSGQEQPFHTVKFKNAARGLDLLSDQRRLAVAHADGHVRLYRMTAPPVEAAPAEVKPVAEKDRLTNAANLRCREKAIYLAVLCDFSWQPVETPFRGRPFRPLRYRCKCAGSAYAAF